MYACLIEKLVNNLNECEQMEEKALKGSCAFLTVFFFLFFLSNAATVTVDLNQEWPQARPANFSPA